MKNADNPDNAVAANPADTASTPSTTTDPTATCPTAPLAAAIFPSMASDRPWDQPTALDLLDLGEAALRRLEAVAHLIGEARLGGAAGTSLRAATGIAELLDDIVAALRAVLDRLTRQQGGAR